MPQLDPASYPSQLFWFAITFVALLLIIWRVAISAISSVLQNRQQSIETDLDFADTFRNEAEELESEYVASLVGVRNDASDVIDAALESTKSISNKKHSELDVVLSKQLVASNDALIKSRDNALGEISLVAIDLSLIIVESLSGINVDKKVAIKAVDSALHS